MTGKINVYTLVINDLNHNDKTLKIIFLKNVNRKGWPRLPFLIWKRRVNNERVTVKNGDGWLSTGRWGVAYVRPGYRGRGYKINNV